MTAVNKEICSSLIKKGKWQDTLCLLCSVRKRSECSNLKEIREHEDRKFEETHDKFDARREQGNEVLLQSPN